MGTTAENDERKETPILAIDTTTKDSNNEPIIGEEGEEIEVHLQSPKRSPKMQARRLLSSRASSLLDKQEEDEEEASDDPGLQVIIEEENNSFHSANESPKSIAVQSSSSGAKQEQPQSPLALITEGMTTYLCPGEIEDDAETVKAQTGATLHRKHHRSVSETDSLQQLTSGGPCGSTPFCGTDMRITEGGTDHAGVSDPRNCTDLSLQDLRQVVAMDVSAVLGSTSGTADLWFTFLHSWMNSNGLSRNDDLRRLLRNGCGRRRIQNQKLLHVWYQWHSLNSHEQQNFDTHNPHTTSRPVWGLSAKSFEASSTNVSDDASDLCYDSDPEVFRRTRALQHAKRSTKPSLVAIDTQASFSTAEAGPLPAAPRHIHGRGGAPSFDTPMTESFETQFSGDSYENAAAKEKKVEVVGFDLHDDETVKAFAKELTMGKITFVWHPSPPSVESSSSSDTASQQQQQQHQQQQSMPSANTPMSVQGWFEMGTRFRNKIVQPKFVWRATYQPDIGQRRLGMSGRAPESLDILSMVRILQPTSIDRTAYPYVKLNRCFTIATNTGGFYVFEALTPGQRDWFVYGLKLVVARLASMVIVGDTQMFAEFFSPWAHVPNPLESSERSESSLEDGNHNNNGSNEEEEDIMATTTSSKSNDDDDDDDNRERRRRQRQLQHEDEESSDSDDTPPPLHVFVSTTDAERESLWGQTPIKRHT